MIKKIIKDIIIGILVLIAINWYKCLLIAIKTVASLNIRP